MALPDTPSVEAKLAELAKLRKLDKAQQKKKLALARTSFPHFCEYVLRDESTGNKVKLAQVHKKWIAHLHFCWSNGLNSIILAPYGTGKCVPAQHRIMLADGSISTAEELSIKESFQIASFDEETWQIAYRPARLVSNGVRPIIRVTLLSGRIIEVTEEHPFYTPTGWSSADCLIEGGYVLAMAQYPELGQKPMLPGSAALFGYAVGDGCLRTGVVIANMDLKVQEDIHRQAKLLGFGSTTSTYKERCPVVRVTSALKWLREHGLYGTDSHSKRTPKAIFKAPNADVAAYLGAYYSCDGHVSTRDGSGSVELYSVNRSLLEDAQSLLLRFGIWARLRQKKGRYKGDVHWSWRLSITGRDELRKFRDHIPVVGEKAAAIKALNLDYPTRFKAGGNPQHDLIPYNYRKHLLWTAFKHKQETGVSLDQAMRGQHGTTRNVVRKAAEAENNDILLRWTDPSIRWDRITAVERLAVHQPTWSIEVQGTNTYIGHDTVMHNTTIIGVALPLFLFGQDTSLRILMVCSNDNLARERIVLIRNYLDYSTEYREVFPTVRSNPEQGWTRSSLFLQRTSMAKDPSLHGAGITSSTVGRRADILILDDVNDAKNTIHQPKMCEVIWQNYTGTYLSRLEPGGKMMGIATRWSEKDLIGYIMNDDTMRDKYGFLIQRVNDDFDAIDCETLIPKNIPTRALDHRSQLEQLFRMSEEGII